jgi:hypothetical protein
MLNTLNSVLPYISGLWTLPWILIGYFTNYYLNKIFGKKKVELFMKKIGLILLFIFIPSLLFRIFLDVDFGNDEIIFSLICFLIIGSMYIISYIFAKFKLKKFKIKGENRNIYINTLLTNQGRSSAFVGGAMLAISEWQTPAALYMSIGAIFLFAIIPYILSYKYNSDENVKIQALPRYLRLFPWYLILFAISSITLHTTTGIYLSDLGEIGILFKFLTALTIPAALYYVGSGIHPEDLKKNKILKLFNYKFKKNLKHLVWVRHIFILNIIITPIITLIIFLLLLYFKFISLVWFEVIIINSLLPITSTNMFLIPYGIDKRVTALSISWSTIICVPLVVLLITVFNSYL